MMKPYIYVDIRDPRPYNSNRVQVTVSFPKDIKYNGKSTGFKCYVHSFDCKGTCQLWLFNSYIASNRRFHHFINTRPYVTTSGTVCVYFYDKDPRPLLICYDGSAYKPNGKSKYYKVWEKVSDVSKCDCTGEDQNEALLKALTTVVGFLNEVNLFKHPPTTTNGTCDSTSSGSPGTAITCTPTNGSTCTYEVHQYVGKSVKIKVTCEDVKGKESGNGKSCYKKLTHQPMGMCDASGDGARDGAESGFRLGNVLYNGNNKQGIIDYYTDNGTSSGTTDNKSDYWWKPLVKVEAYFYNEDKSYKDPLLVELVFSSGSGGNVYEYYKLKSREPSTMTWAKDSQAPEKVKQNGEGLVKHLDCIRYELKKVLKVDIAEKSGYAIQLSKKPGGTDNEFEQLPNGGAKKIDVAECQTGVCSELKENNYKCYKHVLTGLTEEQLYQIGGLAFTIPGESDKDIELKLNGQNGEIKPLFYNKCMGDVYVFFYDQDPRPLLLCYNKKAYTAQSKACYFEKWVEVPGISKCDCTDPIADVTKLLKALTEVVGFLNEVDLSKYPPGTGGNGCNTGSGSGSANSCATTTEGASCTYPVHTYNGATVKIRVTCEPVTPTPPSSNGSCYKKLIHEPIGMCDEGSRASTAVGAPGFRLGDVVYNNNGRSEKGKIHYYPENGDGNQSNKSGHWCKPLISVSAYFYNEDTNYKDPLLVVLEFKKNGDGANVCECYKLIMSSGTGSKMEWAKDKSAGDKVKKPNELVKHLDGIRYGLKKVLKLDISQKVGQYQVMGKAGKATGTGNGFSQLNGDKDVEVDVCEKTCSELTEHKYKCFRHQISQLGEKFDYNEIGGVALTIPGKNGNPIEIELYNGTTADANCKNGEPIQLFYNKCMGDVYVFFYNKGGGSAGTEVDKVPLMLWYDKNYYKPCDREKYFEKWVPVNGIDGTNEPCDGGEELAKQLEAQLDTVNRALNRIDLEKSNEAGSGASNGYGLPETVVSSSGSVNVNTLDFPIERVKLTRQDGPQQSPNTPAYYKIVHRTSNGFTIGDIKYKGNDFATSGVKINGAQGGSGTAEIKVKNGGHTSLVTKNKWNTVVAYYSKDDTDRKLPQLIVIFKTDGPIEGTGTVTTSTPYGYYILSAKSGDSAIAGSVAANGYEYKWVPVNGQTTVTLDDATDFRLLNSIVILLDRKDKNGGGTGSYDEGKIGPAISKAGLKSPGQDPGNINRLKGKEITLKDETNENYCIKQANFKVITHDISELVTLTGSLAGQLGSTTLIAGLRFLIPTRNRKEDYKELQLIEGGKNGIHYYQPTGDQNNKICVFFYDQDPRPLMLCYNNCGYSPKIMYSYFRRWVKITELKSCVCKGTQDDNGKELLEALVGVSNFLNALNIKVAPRDDKTRRKYVVHFFKGDKIKIKVEKEQTKENFCYNKYTHAHCGTDDCKSDGSGFRLGKILYVRKCVEQIKSEGTSNGTCITSALDNGEKDCKYTAASKVVVFYYQGDTNLERPLLVALCNKGSDSCTLYYELQKDDRVGSTVKKYKRGTEPSIDLSDSTQLSGILDDIRYKIAITLQIILDRIPKPILLCYPPREDETKNGQKKNNGKSSTPPKLPKSDCQERKPDEGSNILLRPASYQAQMYKPEGQPLPNGTAPTPTPTTTAANTTSATPSTATIQVTQVKCPQLTTYGYRCYEHQIKTLTGVEEIGGLKFFLWDNTGQGGGSSQGCTNTGGTTTGASCTTTAGGDTNCKELCLYKASGASAPEGASSCPNVVPGSNNQSSCGVAAQSLVKITTSYTTCKGNVYVYFYGDDPRPLMLCYDGNAYGPRCLEDYDSKWVCVPGVTGCVVKDGKCTGLASTDVLNALYRASMFLNPVQLGLTRCAFQHETGKTCQNGVQNSDQNGKNSNGNSANGDAHTTSKEPYKYPIHQYNTQTFCVTIKPTDLSCYRQYVHRPEKAGFRLGQVTYTTRDEDGNGCKDDASKTCPSAQAAQSTQCTSQPSKPSTSPFCFPYTTSKQLIGVALYYYMYDCSHEYPLIVELQFKGEVSEYYRLVCNGGSGKTWVKMIDPSANKKNGSKNGGQQTTNDTCDDNQGGGSSCKDAVKNCTTQSTPTDTCQLDQDFARNAKRIEERILALNMANQVDQVDFMALTAELLLLIERRAYKIRKKLVAESQWKKENLIMATDKNCDEESKWVYVLSGGAVGVAGGGGWKAMVFMLGMLVKL